MIRHEDIKKQINELFHKQNLAVLSTNHAEQTYANLIAFVGEEDLREIFFITQRATWKFVNLSADSIVVILINSSLNVDADFHEAVAATVLDNAKETSAADKARVRDLYLAKHPYLEAFANLYCNFQKQAIPL